MTTITHRPIPASAGRVTVSRIHVSCRVEDCRTPVVLDLRTCTVTTFAFGEPDANGHRPAGSVVGGLWGDDNLVGWECPECGYPAEFDLDTIPA